MGDIASAKLAWRRRMEGARPEQRGAYRLSVECWTMLNINETPDGEWATGRILHDKNVHTVRLSGSLDEHTVSQLRELSEVVFGEKGFSEGDHFLVDIREVTEVDHVGLAALVGIIVGLAAKAGSAGLIIPEDHPVRHALQVTGLDRVFEMHETNDAARITIIALNR